LEFIFGVYFLDLFFGFFWGICFWDFFRENAERSGAERSGATSESI
jgi:hypothetical protein